MNKDILINADERKVYFVETYFHAFDGDIRAWKDAYFNMLSLKNTFSAIRSLDLVDCCNQVQVVCRVDNKKTADIVKTFMEENGYKDVTISEVNALCLFQLFEDEIEEITNYTYLD